MLMSIQRRKPWYLFVVLILFLDVLVPHAVMDLLVILLPVLEVILTVCSAYKWKHGN